MSEHRKEIKRLLKDAKEAVDSQEYESALQYAQQALELDSENSDVWTMVAITAHKMTRLDQSEQAYRRVLKLSPGVMPAWRGLSEVLMEQAEAAAEDGDRLAEIREALLESLGRFEELAGDAQGKKILELRAVRARTLQQVGNQEQAVEAFRALTQCQMPELGWVGLVDVLTEAEKARWTLIKNDEFKKEAAAFREKFQIIQSVQLNTDQKDEIRKVCTAVCRRE